jgi:flagellin-like hook-associated protein FlgL
MSGKRIISIREEFIMAMIVKNNMSAINTLNTLNKNSTALSKSLQKVSSGMKINSAADDASGYAISERMRVQIRSLDQANQNTQNGSSMMKVAEGAVSSTVDILKTLKEKVINAANDTNTDSDRQTIQKELDQSIDQIDDNANVTFNGKYLVDGSKNTAGKATYTALTNQNLASDTNADTKLTALKSRSGDGLELSSTDKLTVSYVQAGKTYSTTFTVGDKTMQDIFTAAENIDSSSSVFATSSNDSVKAAGGTTNASSVSAEAKAIDYLKSQLANGTSANAATTAGVSKAGATAVTAATTSKLIANNQGQNLATNTYKDTNGDTYGAGALYTNVINSDKALAKAEAAIGVYDSANPTDATKTYGTAGTLGKALAKAGISWDGAAATLDTSDMATKLESAYADPTNTGLKEAVAAYREDATDLATAKTNMKSSVAAFERATDQLEALTAQKKVTDAQTAATAQRTAFETVAGAAIDASTKLTYTDVTSLTADGTVTPSTATADKVDATDATKTAAKAALSAALDKMEGLADPGAAIAKTLAVAVFGTGTAGTDALTGTAVYKTALDAVKTAKTALDATTTSGSKGTDGTTAKKLKDALKDAQDNVVSKFSGPAVLTGSNVGVNGAGEVVSTANGNNAITLTANAAGVGGQISGFNISVADSKGNVKKSANASLDAFDETVRAQNESADNAIALQVGSKANQSIKVGLTDMRSEALGLKGADGTKLNISTQTKANAAVNVLDNALQKALDQQTTIGSVESRLEYTSSNLTTASSNVQASESTIRDADMAKEMTEYTKNNVLLQAAQSMLSQANQNSSSVLSLLK